MKTTLQFIVLFFCAISLGAQSSITVKINHLLNGNEFEYDTNAKNDLGNDFKLDRLEYYLSTFSVTHDGGQVTTIDDLYVLISLQSKIVPTEIDLGEMDIQNIESVSFYLGIDEETNHADPALWPADHALAPKFPSMHWGWASGYRFIALEGSSGPNVDQDLQFHCIGDEFYEEMSFPVTSSGPNSYTFEIDAEYSNILSDIDISNGLIQHGNLGDIKTLADNLKQKVFTAAEVTNVKDSELVKTFEVYPNPSRGELITINADVRGNGHKIKVVDLMGRTVFNTLANTETLDIPEPGLYFISLVDKQENVLATRKLIIQ